MHRILFCLILLFSSLYLLGQEQDRHSQYINLSYGEIDKLIDKYSSENNHSEVISVTKAGRIKAKADFGEIDTTFAFYTQKMGEAYLIVSEYTKALPLLLQTKDIAQKIFGEEHSEFATALNDLAVLYESMGNYEEALPLHKQSLRIRRQIFGETHPKYGTSLSNLALLYTRMQEYDKALPLSLQSKDISEKFYGKQHPDFALSINNLAHLYSKMGDYNQAIPLFIKNKEIVQAALGKAHPDYSRAIHNLAASYQHVGAYEKALPLYLETIDIDRIQLGENHAYFGLSIDNLANLYSKMGNYDQAIPLYKKALAIYDKTISSNHPICIAALRSLSVAYFNTEEKEKGWNSLSQAMNSASTIQVEHNFDENWRDSLKVAPYPSNQHIIVMLLSLDLAYHEIEEDGAGNSVDKQKIITELATAILNRSISQVTNEKDKLRLLAESDYWLSYGLAVLNPAQNAVKAFELGDQNKSVLLLQSIKSEENYSLGALPDSLVQQDKNLNKKRSQLKAYLLQSQGSDQEDSLRNELINLEQEIETFLQLVKNDYPKYHQLQYQDNKTNTTEIQALLDEKTALLEYVITDSILHIFKLTQTETVWQKEALSRDSLQAQIKAFHNSLSNYRQITTDGLESYRNYSELAHWFYQQLIQPILDKEEIIENLVIITDGELGHLPFEAFLVKPAPEKRGYKNLHYLLRDYTISYSYSAALWKDNKTAQANFNNGELLALAANYNTKADSSAKVSRSATARSLRESLQPLPAARQEVEALAEHYQGFFAFDSLATERTVLDKAANYAIIHLATHGILDEQRPILSSLALTDNNDSLYDNFWQAHEISKMELNADLVVLSACETGYGRFEIGNGIASLARAFMYAGVPSLVVSLWQVSDASTSTLMQSFYAHLADGLDKAQALRQAKLDYIANVNTPLAAHPAFWSPFILMGDSEPVELAEQGAGNWIWYAAGVAALLVLGVVLWRR